VTGAANGVRARVPATPSGIAAAVLGLLAAVLLVVVAPVLPGGAGGARAATDPSPLEVELTSVTPGAIPQKGPIVLEGVVRNPTDETWTGLRAYPLTSQAPMTTRDEVEQAALSDPDTVIGNRVPEAGTDIGDIPPGGSSTFRIRFPHRDLRITGAPGVYWIGVHVLGASSAGRDLVADGRARTFIPLVPARAVRATPAQVTLVVPLRREVRYAADGSLLRAPEIAHALDADGRLGRIAALARHAGARSLTWLVDPAVLDAARDIADDNPVLDLGRARTTRPAESPSSRRRSTPSDSADANAAPAADLTDADRATAQDWLASVTGLIRSGTALALPYADPDVSAVARRDPALLGRARAVGRQVLDDRQITATPALAPPDGYLDPAVVGTLGQDAGTGGGELTVLLSDHGKPVTGPVRVAAGHRFVYADARTAQGGPRPAARLSALALRQRILADAALTALDGARAPLVVVLPSNWDPGPDWQRSDFFGGLDQPWLVLTSLPAGSPATAPGTTEPPAARREEVPRHNVVVAGQLVHTAAVVGALLDAPVEGGAQDGDKDSGTNGGDDGGKNGDGDRSQGGTAAEDAGRQAQRLAGAALGAASYHARNDPALARERVQALDRTISDLLARVRVVGTDFVTLSGSSGVLTVSLVNGLDKPVRIGLRASTGTPDVRIDEVEPVRLAAGQRSTVRLQAHAGGVGVHRVTLSAVTADGDRLGTPLVFNLRTSQVGRVFWGLLVACAVLLAAAVARRVRQRLRSPRRRP
jgi:hypothetical protein